MEKKIKKVYVERFIDELDINNPVLKKLVYEMMLSNSYAYQRVESVLLGVTPFVEISNIDLDKVKQIMLDREIDFIQSTLRIESIDNCQGYVDIRYKTSLDSSWENSATIYFSDLVKKDEDFKKFLNWG